jgi:hypothetical protein
MLVTAATIVPLFGQQGNRLESRFRQLDRNHDGRLSRDELRQTPNIMRADNNGDEAVTLEEAREHFRGRNRPPQPERTPNNTTAGIFRLQQHIPMRSGPLAVGVLDANTDGWPDLVLPCGRVSGQFLGALNRPDDDRGRAFEVQTLRMSDDPADNAKSRATKGLGLHDFNNDGRMDIYLANRNGGGPSLGPDGEVRQPRRLSSSINSVQISGGDGNFTTQDLGINSRGSEVRSVVFADFDGDGNIDSFHVVSPYYGPGWGGSPIGNELHPGTERWNRFGPDIIRKVLPEPSFWQDKHGRAIKMFKATLVRDFDGDGLPDIVTGAYADIWGGSMRRNQTPEDAKLDLDDDGIPDTTWPGYWDRGLFLLRNVSTPGEIRFQDVSNAAIERAYSDGTKYPQMHVYSIVAADIDRDADLDLLVTGPRNVSAHRSVEDRTPTVRLLRNDSVTSRLKFTDITKESGLAFLNAERVTGYRLRRGVPNLAAGVPLDYDNDGHVDFVFVDRQDGAGGMSTALRPWVFHNTGSGHLDLVSPDMHGLVGHFNDLSASDFDNDGRVDLVFVNGDPRDGGKAAVFRNAVENSSHWVKLRITWPENRFGLESKVTVFKAGTQEILGYDEVRTDFCYRSKRSSTLHFGLGSVDRIDVEVVTRDGREKRFEGVTVDELHTLEIASP